MKAIPTFTPTPETYVDAQEKLGALIDRAVAIRAQQASLDAELAEVIEKSRHQLDRMGKSPLNDLSLRAEVAAALKMSSRGAGLLINDSYILVNQLPATLAALKEGTIQRAHAAVIIDQASMIPDEAKRQFENTVIPYVAASTASPSKLKVKARRLREWMNPESISKRRTKAIQDRGVWVTPGEDGMAELTALLPQEQATAIYDRVTEIAMGLNGPEEDRNLAQIRADVFADSLINSNIEAGIGIGAGIVAKVWVSVPVMTLLGHEDTPGDLEGRIPIAPEVARDLAAHAPSFTRILTHPETGVVLSMGRDTYRPSKDLQNFIRMGDGTCRCPANCPCRARFTQIDHTIRRVDGGETDAENLECLCEAHHLLKDNSAWKVEQLGGGVLRWTSPGLKSYVTRPQTLDDLEPLEPEVTESPNTVHFTDDDDDDDEEDDTPPF